MPYSVNEDTDICPLNKPWAVTKTATGKLIGCHDTQGHAQAQVIAITLSEKGNSMTTSNVERRFTVGRVEIRAGSDARTFGGYAAKFDRPSKNLGGFIETIDRGFFNKSRGDGWPGVMARYNHDDNMLLGTSDAGTLRLSTDDVGLLYEVDPPKSRADVAELVERGDVRKSSFAFVAFDDDWGMSDQGFPLRTLISGSLVDVAPVNVPAYDDTSVAMASLAKRFDADVAEVRKLAAADELVRFFKRTDNTGPAPVNRSAHLALAQALAIKA